MELILNMKDGTLSYTINGTDYGVAFENIDTTQSYRLAVSVSLRAKGSVVKLR